MLETNQTLGGGRAMRFQWGKNIAEEKSKEKIFSILCLFVFQIEVIFFFGIILLQPWAAVKILIGIIANIFFCLWSFQCFFQLPLKFIFCTFFPFQFSHFLYFLFLIIGNRVSLCTRFIRGFFIIFDFNSL